MTIKVCKIMTMAVIIPLVFGFNVVNAAGSTTKEATDSTKFSQIEMLAKGQYHLPEKASDKIDTTVC